MSGFVKNFGKQRIMLRILEAHTILYEWVEVAGHDLSAAMLAGDAMKSSTRIFYTYAVNSCSSNHGLHDDH